MLPTVLLIHLGLVSALSISSPQQISNPNNNGSEASSFHSNRSLLLHDPTPPPGFRVTPNWFPNTRLSTPQVWLWLFTFQSALAAHPARQPLPQSTVLSKPALNLVIQVTVSNPALTYGEVIWGLYEAGVATGSRQGRASSLVGEMPGLGLGLFIAQEPLRGYIKIGSLRTLRTLRGLDNLPGANTTAATARRAEEVRARRRRRSGALAVRDSGDARSREDRFLVVHYLFDGQELAPGRVLTAFLRTMVFCAEHEEEEGFGAGSMVAFSADGMVRLRMDGVGGAGLSWRMARLALRTMWVQVVMEFQGYSPESPRWEGFSFIVEYRGVRVGQGWIG